jgi:hypothetical protein
MRASKSALDPSVSIPNSAARAWSSGFFLDLRVVDIEENCKRRAAVCHQKGLKLGLNVLMMVSTDDTQTKWFKAVSERVSERWLIQRS